MKVTYSLIFLVIIFYSSATTISVYSLGLIPGICLSTFGAIIGGCFLNSYFKLSPFAIGVSLVYLFMTVPLCLILAFTSATVNILFSTSFVILALSTLLLLSFVLKYNNFQN